MHIFSKFLITLSVLIPSFVLNAQNFEDRSKNSLTNKIIKAYEQGTIDHTTMIRNRLNALVDIDKVDNQFIDGTPIIEKCATTNVLVLRAEIAKLSKTGELSPSEVNSIEGVLTRVTKQKFLVSPSGKFRIQYDTTGTHAVYQPTVDLNPADGHPDYVNRTAEIFDYVHDVEVNQMGYTPPPPDATSGGGTNQYDVYMHKYSGAYGVCFSDGTVNNYGTPPRTAYKSYIYVDPTYEGFGYTDRTLPLKVTAAHEYFHAIQFAYNINAGNWFMEISSTWIEDLVYDEINDYRYYLSAFFNSPKTSLTKFDGSHEYASCIYGHYISENFGNIRMKRIWDFTVNAGSNIALNAIQSALTEIGTNRSDVFAGFTVWNYLTGLRANGTHPTYSEGSSFPSINIATTNTTFPVSTTAPTGLEFLATFYHHFSPLSTPSNLRLGFNQISPSAWKGKVVVDSSNRFRSFDVDLSTGIGTTDLLSFNNKTRAVFIPSNVATTGTNLSYSYTANIHTLPTVLTPSGGEILNIDNVYDITWSSTGITNIKIDYSTNNGSDWLTVAASVPATPATYSWTVPNIPSTQALVKVSSSTDANLSDLSNNVFTIQHIPTITLLSSDGGEVFPIGFQKNIQWSSVNVSGNVKIELSRNGGSTYETLFASSPNDGSENWVVSGDITERARIKITSLTLPTVFDSSNENFFIRVASITLLSPNGGELHRVGVTYPISWESQNMLGDAKIELSRDGGTSYETILASTPNDGQEEWLVSAPISNFARIKVTAFGNENIFDVSDNNYFVTPEHFIAIQNPTESNGWLIDSSYQIEWVSFGTSGDVKIELSNDLGETYETLFETTPDDGEENWTPKSPASASAIIKISDVLNQSFSQTSEKFLIGYRDTLKFQGGWNLVALSSIIINKSKSFVFPSSSSAAYEFKSGYVPTENLHNGRGYWLKFPLLGNNIVVGVPKLNDTIMVSQGWNLIGGLSLPYKVSNMISEPPAIISSYVYSYNFGYEILDTLYPGKGAWLKAKQDGKLILSADVKNSSSKTYNLQNKLNGSSSIEFRDNSNNYQVLFFDKIDKNRVDINFFELPPVPPSTAFDIRYISNNIIEPIEENRTNEFTINLQSVTYPITLTYKVNEGYTVFLIYNGVEVSLVSKGELIISKPITSVLKLQVTSDNRKLLPNEFSLAQNYPNPFNPSTRISYGIPYATYVSLRLFNLLGSEIGTIVNEYKEAGYYEIDLNIFDDRFNNRSGLPGGVYYYQLQSDGKVLTRKAILLK